MRKLTSLALALLSTASLSCGDRSTAPTSPTPPPPPFSGSRLQVFVQWQGQGVADRQLDILELGLTQTTDAKGVTVFEIPAGTYTLRAYVTGPGPSGRQDIGVVTRSGETEHVQVTDCIPCVSTR